MRTPTDATHEGFVRIIQGVLKDDQNGFHVVVRTPLTLIRVAGIYKAPYPDGRFIRQSDPKHTTSKAAAC